LACLPVGDGADAIIVSRADNAIKKGVKGLDF